MYNVFLFQIDNFVDFHRPSSEKDRLKKLIEFIFVLNVIYVGCKVVAQGGL